MSSHYFEKPKDWKVAPENTWVSGKPIGQSDIKMPSLGDPGAHEDSSSKMSFGDEGMGAETTFRVTPDGKQVKPGEPCPEGTETKGSTCAPSKDKPFVPSALRRGGKAKKEEDKEGKGNVRAKSTFEREIPRAPETDRQIRQLAKEGVKARLGKQ
jgi:hypothetical protein